MTLSAWLRAAAHDRLQEQQRSTSFDSPDDVKAFFDWCDALEGPDSEPEWEEHLKAIDQSRRRGASDT